MSRLQNLVGVRFGRLIVRERDGSYRGQARWLCRCDCGGTKSVPAYSLTNGMTSSCGCFQRERIVETKTIHRGTGTREYKGWQGMRARCRNPNDAAWKDYGGRGITVCIRWDNSFAAFLEDMGRCPPGMTLDRVDNSRGYEPGNCRWATMRVQNWNRRSTRRTPGLVQEIVALRAKGTSITAIAKRCGIGPTTVRRALAA